MKAKVTKTLANWLNEKLKNTGYKAKYEELTPQQYDWNVGDTSMDTLEYDYNFSTGKYKVIKIIYPDDYYACNAYLTTQNLIDCIKHTKNHTENEFFDNIWGRIEI